MTKIISYNVNGIRAALRKDLSKWLKSANPDIVCLQEIEAKKNQIDASVFEKLGYNCFWYPAKKPGYSGTAILSKVKPDKVHFGIGIEAYDDEGRIIRVDYNDISVISVYMPSGSSGEIRQEFKMKFLKDFYHYILQLKKEKKKLIISGDYNICHHEIDIHNPTRNKNTSGFLPEERNWITEFLKMGFVDSFREINKSPNQYTWWSYRANARAKNLGWRIDYHVISEELNTSLNGAKILSKAIHSDHCPILIDIDF